MGGRGTKNNIWVVLGRHKFGYSSWPLGLGARMVRGQTRADLHMWPVWLAQTLRVRGLPGLHRYCVQVASWASCCLRLALAHSPSLRLAWPSQPATNFFKKNQNEFYLKEIKIPF